MRQLTDALEAEMRDNSISEKEDKEVDAGEAGNGVGAEQGGVIDQEEDEETKQKAAASAGKGAGWFSFVRGRAAKRARIDAFFKSPSDIVSRLLLAASASDSLLTTSAACATLSE